MAEMLKQISFGKLDEGMDMPHLLDIQTRAFDALLQLDAASHDREDIGLERVFKDLFPITDVHENFSLEFKKYTLGEPKYSVEECIERVLLELEREVLVDVGDREQVLEDPFEKIGRAHV